MIKFTVAAAALAIGLASSAFAGPADDAIKARQACMKSHGALMGVAGELGWKCLRGPQF